MITTRLFAALIVILSLLSPICLAGAAEIPTAVIAPVDDAWRARLPRNPEAATQAYLDRLSPEDNARSDAYFEGGYWLQLWGFLYGLGVAWLLLGTRLSGRMRDFAERLTRRKPLQTVAYAVQYFLATWLLTLPLTTYAGFFREHQYGLATQSFGPWFAELLVTLGITVVLGSVGLAIIYGVIRRAQRTWWLWGAVVSMVLFAFVSLISPLYIDPLFNTYKPLEEGPVKSAILSMARANDVPADNVYEFDASRQTTRISANVGGFLGTTRIALNDNLLTGTSPVEIKAVMAHELGHYVLNHIYKMIVTAGLLTAIGFALIQRAFDGVNARWGRLWDVRGVGDTAGLPLLAGLLSAYLFVMTPVINTIIRSQEIEADMFGLNAAAEPDGFAEVALKLSVYRKMAPGPIEELIFFDHPSGRNRIHAAMRWKAEKAK
jgi:STE24 endopeptidase